MKRSPYFQWFAAVVCAALLGCGAHDRAAKIEAVLETDPGFEKVLLEHQNVLNRMQTYDNEWQLKKTKVEHTIRGLHEDLERARADTVLKTERLRESIMPQRQLWMQAMDRANEELRERKIQRGSLGRSVAKLQKVVRLAGEAWPQDERERQEAQLAQMLQDLERIEQEVSLIQEHVRLLKLKLELTEFPS